MTKENHENHLTEDDVFNYLYWLEDGGEVTLNQFCNLTREEQQQDIIEYIEESDIYTVLEEKGKKYVLVHAGIHNFNQEQDLDEYSLSDFIFHRTDYSKKYYKGNNIYVVTGHSPTALIREDKQPIVYRGNGHIAIDCGCVFGGQLAAYCIETDKVIYVKSKHQ